jgi:hypothetical protein
MKLPVRRIIFPLAATLGMLGIAMLEWSEHHRRMTMATDFHQGSKVVNLRDLGTRAGDHRSVAAYAYDEGGVSREFISHRSLLLPPGGRVRLGPDPAPESGGRSSFAEIAVPMSGTDSVETVYQGMFRRSSDEDRTKPLMLTLAAFAVGMISFFLQRQIIRGMRPPTRR